jgi:CDP-paratose synthetase
MEKTVLVTGATGFLGSHLVKALLADGYCVAILKRSFSKTWRIDDVMNQVISFDLDRVSLTDVFTSLKKIDTVIHTATSYGRNGESCTQLLETNVVFPLNLLETAISFNTDTFLNTDTFFNTDTILSSYLSTYSLSKKHFQDWGKQIAQQKAIKFINLKLEHIFGAGDDDSKFVTYIIKSCLNNVEELKLTKGEQKRDFIHVDDVVAIYQFLLDNVQEQQDFYQEYDIGSGEAISIRDLVEMIHSLTHSKTILKFGDLPYRERETQFSQANLESLKKIGLNMNTDLQQALSKTIDNWRHYSLLMRH